MRHGVLASVALLTFICLAAGDEPKRLDTDEIDVSKEGSNQNGPDEDQDERALREYEWSLERGNQQAAAEQEPTDLDTEIEEFETKLEHLEKAKRRAEESGAKHDLADIRERTAAAKRYLHELQAVGEQRRKDRRSYEINATRRQIEHIRIAVKHLKAAGLHELAHDLMEKAVEMEREVGQAKKRRTKEQEDLRRELHETLEQIESERQEIERKYKLLQQKLEELDPTWK